MEEVGGEKYERQPGERLEMKLPDEETMGGLDRNTERHKQWSKRLLYKKAQLVCS